MITFVRAFAACRVLLGVGVLVASAHVSAQSPPVASPPSCPVDQDVPAVPPMSVSNTSEAPSISALDMGAVDAAAATTERTRQAALFKRFETTRPSLDATDGIVAQLSVTQRMALDTASTEAQRVLVGEALPIAVDVDFSGLELSGAGSGSIAHARGRISTTAEGGVVWETEIISPEAKALRLHIDHASLADGVRLYVYNAIGQIDGPYSAEGPDENGEWWTASIVGERMRVRVEADNENALVPSRIAIADVIHLGPHFQVTDAIERSYAPDAPVGRGSFCGTDLPACTVNAQCAINTNPSLANAARAVAHINFMVGAQAFICTGTLINSTGGGARPPLFLTANHCLSTQASATTLEAIFDYRTTACDTSCTMTPTVSVNGSTLLATGAAPAPDFTLLRLASMPAGRILLGWTTEVLAEGSHVLHLSHPAGAPLAYDVRRLRAAGLPVCGGVPRPAFLYTGLNLQAGDAVGATVGGSSGSAALVLHPTFGPAIVGQLFGGCTTNDDECDANANATLDGALRSSFPNVRRFIYDGIFSGGFQAN